MASQNDFEEFGVDQSTLTEMREVCGNISFAQPLKSILSLLLQQSLRFVFP